LVTWQGITSGIALGATAAGLGVAIRRGDRLGLYIMSSGLIITLGFNAPFALVSKREQFHLLALGAVMLLAGAAVALHAIAARWPRTAALIAVVVTLPLALHARSQAADFFPCAPIVVDLDRAATGWWVVPAEVNAWLDQKALACREGTAHPKLTDLPMVSWGLHEEERDQSGETFRWTSDHAVMLIARQTSSRSFVIRRPDASPENPVSVTIRGGTTPLVLVLTSDAWERVTVTLEPDILTSWRDAHRLDLEVTPWFVPAVLDPKSLDLRRFGVQIRVND
jgi:hypothetical protein